MGENELNNFKKQYSRNKLLVSIGIAVSTIICSICMIIFIYKLSTIAFVIGIIAIFTVFVLTMLLRHMVSTYKEKIQDIKTSQSYELDQIKTYVEKEKLRNEREKNKKTFCPYCGAKNNPEDKHCSECGSLLE